MAKTVGALSLHVCSPLSVVPITHVTPLRTLIWSQEQWAAAQEERSPDEPCAPTIPFCALWAEGYPAVTLPSF